ncbi:MAG: TIGR02147 family protein [Fibrobacteria bacterium]|nr:TIGR02147 family protein [Fibrobacteria bacterium]
MRKIPISVYNYTDYRKFLNDYFDYLKKTRGIILQDICDEVKDVTTGHLSAVLHGKNNISKRLITAFAKYCRLKKMETEYFKTMVAYNQKKKLEVKKASFDKLISFRKSCVYKVSTHSYQYYERWYHSAIRAMCEFMDIKDDYAGLAKMLVPSIRAHEAKNSLTLLSELELIEPGEDGFFRPTAKAIDSGVHDTSITVNNFMVSMLEKAKESIDKFGLSERMLSWNTVGLNQAGYDEIMKKIIEFRYEVGKIVQKHSADRVYQINIQAFPLTKPLVRAETTADSQRSSEQDGVVIEETSD